jgi:hypothetical protein
MMIVDNTEKYSSVFNNNSEIIEAKRELRRQATDIGTGENRKEQQDGETGYEGILSSPVLL